MQFFIVDCKTPKLYYDLFIIHLYVLSIFSNKFKCMLYTIYFILMLKVLHQQIDLLDISQTLLESAKFMYKGKVKG